MIFLGVFFMPNVSKHSLRGANYIIIIGRVSIGIFPMCCFFTHNKMNTFVSHNFENQSITFVGANFIT